MDLYYATIYKTDEAYTKGDQLRRSGIINKDKSETGNKNKNNNK